MTSVDNGRVQSCSEGKALPVSNDEKKQPDKQPIDTDQAGRGQEQQGGDTADKLCKLSQEEAQGIPPDPDPDDPVSP